LSAAPGSVSKDANNEKNDLDDDPSESDGFGPVTEVKSVPTIFLLSTSVRIESPLEDHKIGNNETNGAESHHNTEGVSESRLAVFFETESSHANEVDAKSNTIADKDSFFDSIVISAALKEMHVNGSQEREESSKLEHSSWADILTLIQKHKASKSGTNNCTDSLKLNHVKRIFRVS